VTPPERRLHWRAAWRIIPTRLPRVNIFARIARPEDVADLEAVEALTNERIRLQSNAPYAHYRGASADLVLAPFAHPNPAGSRFSDGSYGVLYAADAIKTATAETIYHREQFLQATREPEMFLPMGAYRLEARGRLHDLRGLQARLKGVYSPTSYAQSQPFAKRLRAAGSCGIVYDSVRCAGGHCIAGFSPELFSHARHAYDLLYLWNGMKITDVLRFSVAAT